MHWPTILATLARIDLIIGLSLAIPLALAVYYGDPLVSAFVIALVISLVTAAGLNTLAQHSRSFASSGEIRSREGAAIVTLGWLSASLLGALPFYLSGYVPDFTEAFFETVSGFTTTGASILTDIEALPRSLLFWRSLTQWLGGMGIVVLFVAVLGQVSASGGNLQIIRAETTGPVTEKVKPRIRETAKTFCLIYLALSVAETLILWSLGMPLFDAVNHTFTTIATGGYSVKNASIGFYESPMIEWTVTAFMFLGGANFALYYHALRNHSLQPFWRNTEFKTYLAIVVGATLLVLARNWPENLIPTEQHLRTAAFQVVSILTTTGYATADFAIWPSFSQVLLVVLMFIGGSSGSTAGAIKVGRLVILAKGSLRELQRLARPRTVLPVTLNTSRQEVPEAIVANIQQFFFLYMVLFAAGWLVLSGLGLDAVSSASAVAATLGNVGPGLGSVGPTANYSAVPDAGKWLLSALMLLGRLELYTILVLLIPRTWRP